MSSYTEKQLHSRVGRAIKDYELIDDADRILIGVSGGLDSLSLVDVLYEKQRRAPVHFDLVPAHIDPGFEGGCSRALSEYFSEQGKELLVEQGDFGPRAHSAENRENPCFYCARQRRKALFELAGKHGCTKIALGHNLDDMIETFFMNMLFAGEMATMVPKQSLFNGLLTIIRPLALAEKQLIRRYGRGKSLPVFENPCPTSKNERPSKRRAIREMLDNLCKDNRRVKIKKNILNAMKRVNTEYLP